MVSLEAWEAINELHVWLHDGSGRQEWVVRPDAFYRQVRTGTQLILGAVEHTMLHDNAFDFILLGVFLERVGQTARILDVHHHALMQLPPDLVREETLWLSLLRACAGFEPFMKRKAGRVTPGEVATFLMLEPRFPRSLAFCVREADQRLASIRSPGDEAFPPLRCQARLAALETFLSGGACRTRISTRCSLTSSTRPRRSAASSTTSSSGRRTVPGEGSGGSHHAWRPDPARLWSGPDVPSPGGWRDRDRRAAVKHRR